MPNDARIDARVVAEGEGCADHTREAFESVTDFPDLAGCRATWGGMPSLRAAKTGTACGDELGMCSVPADACDAGWHVCGDNGDPLEVYANATAAQCATVGGAGQAYAGALSHCATQGPICDYAPPFPCLGMGEGCTEPVCCGPGCTGGQSCKDGVYANATRVVSGGVGYACNALQANTITGVMCCRDERTRQSGCADGQREAFTDEATFPEIAGCAASWTTRVSMRDPATGSACGDDLGDCAAPADACAPGWELCGTNGNPAQITSRVSDQQCNEQSGQFAAALSHCTDAAPCVYSPPYSCLPGGADCAEAVCCGDGCSQSASCSTGVFPTGTRINTGGASNGCASLAPALVTGVMCCAQ